MAEAGWQPSTEAACDNDQIFGERFGPGAQGTLYLTLINDTTQAQSGMLTVNLEAMRKKAPQTARELVSGKTLEKVGGSFRVSLQAQEAAVIHFAE